MPVDGKPHTLYINAYASGDEDDYLAYVVVYRNGQVFKQWDIRDEKLRQYKTTVNLTEKEKAWYVVKVYGKQAWNKAAYLDIMDVCSKNDTAKYPDFGKVKNEVAITSPFYFWPNNTKAPPPLQSAVNITVVSPATNQPLEKVMIELLVNGRLIKNILLQHGKGTFNMPVNAVLRIKAVGYTTIYRTLYLDYPPHLALVEELATGKWRDNYEQAKFNPGEVPWEAFHYEETKKVLSQFTWQIKMQPNERDGLWEKFDKLF